MSYMKRAINGSEPVTPTPLVPHCCTRCGAERMVLHVEGEERICEVCIQREASPDVEQDDHLMRVCLRAENLSE